MTYPQIMEEAMDRAKAQASDEDPLDPENAVEAFFGEFGISSDDLMRFAMERFGASPGSLAAFGMGAHLGLHLAEVRGEMREAIEGAKARRPLNDNRKD